ncbi:hypothetical protein FRC03_001768 [Tulasnella sp. 419]|nr:hypothetical protein FRC03_001768 [Tulasnella sp. 419]
MTQQLLFSAFDVTCQTFFRSKLSYAIVNLKPIVPGHVLVIPNRVVPRLSDLTHDEISDLFNSVAKIGVVVEKAYTADSLTIAVQDGPAAGQSVAHVHVHVLPRRFTDFGGQNDSVYPALEEGESRLVDELVESQSRNNGQRSLLKVDNEERHPRSIEDMKKEASWLSQFFAQE